LIRFSKDTACAVQELDVLSLKQRSDGAMKFAQASTPTIEQIASEAALDTPQSYFDEVISEYRERRDTLVTELNKIEGVVVSKPKVFYCIAQLPLKMLMILRNGYFKPV
jgi:aspartate/methionine/tyrosine aminotransferase